MIGQQMSGAPPEPSPTGNTDAPERFDELLARLRGLVEKLEGGHVSLEDGLRSFEEGMTLCRKGAEILDRAERRVEVLLSSGGGNPNSPSTASPRTAPFEASPGLRDEGA
jgi:exodeoxyribonuclease VII small subunit